MLFVRRQQTKIEAFDRSGVLPDCNRIRGHKRHTEIDRMVADEQFLPLAAYPEHLVRIALERREIIQPLLNIERLTRGMVRQRVLDIKACSCGTAGGKNIEHISVASLYRWIRSPEWGRFKIIDPLRTTYYRCCQDAIRSNHRCDDRYRYSGVILVP